MLKGVYVAVCVCVCARVRECTHGIDSSEGVYGEF